jgi:DNA-binding transcriptional ArsR family regulator
MKGTTGYKKQAELFRALSHPVRLRILDVLARQEACVCHLTALLGQRQPYISQQLATLREAGLVVDRREGTLIYYHLANGQTADLLEHARAVVTDLETGGLVFPAIPEEALDNCPCPRCQGA